MIPPDEEYLKGLNRSLGDKYDRYWEHVERSAEVVFEKFVKPFCQKHKLRFTSGMGAWIFSRSGRPAETDRIHIIIEKRYPQLYALLETEIPGTDDVVLGLLMPSYPETAAESASRSA